MRAGCLMLLLAVCLLAGGCGSTTAKKTTASAPPPAGTTTTPPQTTNGPDATVRGYFTALAMRDGAKACGQLTAGARGQALATVDKSRKKKFKSCGLALKAVVAGVSNATLQALDVQITKSEIHGNRATVAVAGGAGDIQLQKVAGRWLIAGGVGGP